MKVKQGKCVLCLFVMILLWIPITRKIVLRGGGADNGPFSPMAEGEEGNEWSQRRESSEKLEKMIRDERLVKKPKTNSSHYKNDLKNQFFPFLSKKL